MPPRPVAALVVLATLPYLALKVLWLTGSTVGLRDPAFAAAPGVAAANAVTAGLDVIVVALAIVLAGRRRIPAAVLLPPLWIGLGLLVPTIALLAVAAVGDAAPDPLAPWVRVLVYGGFTVQGAGLAVLAGLHARRRWPAAWSPGTSEALPRTLTRAAAPVLLAVGVARVAALTGFAIVVGLLLVAGAVGAFTVVERGGQGVTAAWIGTGAAAGWGLYGLVNQLAGTAFTDGDPVGGLLDLAQVLAGGVLWLALLTTLSERVQEVPGSRMSASKQV